MSANGWKRRINRADELAGRYSFAAEILRFYSAIARFQEQSFEAVHPSLGTGRSVTGPDPFIQPIPQQFAARFRPFLAAVERNGPAKLQENARGLAADSDRSHLELLTLFWQGDSASIASGLPDFFARAFLQPLAVSMRMHANFQWKGPTAYVCPFCRRKPGVGVLRPMGDGGQRLLVCSFCLAEWEFRRILCAGCGEMDPAKLPVYAAEEMEHVRVDACDSCKTYLKTVDFTKAALGEPVVDEIATVPLDLWAQGRGYTKLQVNLLQL